MKLVVGITVLCLIGTLVHPTVARLSRDRPKPPRDDPLNNRTEEIMVPKGPSFSKLDPLELTRDLPRPRTQDEANSMISGQRGLKKPDLVEASFLGNVLKSVGDMLEDFGDRVELLMDDLNERYPPVQKLFDDVVKMRNRLSGAKRRLLNKLANSDEGEAISGFNLTRMSKEDVLSLLDDLEQIPEPVRDKLISHLSNCTDEEIRNLPSNILPAFGQGKLAELKSLGRGQLEIVCDKLLDDGSSPWNLVSAVRGGLRCSPMPDLTNKKKCKLTVSKVMMDLVRMEIPPSTWNNTFLTKALSYIGAGVKADDILAVPDNVVQGSIQSLSRTDLPYPSQRKALVRKLVSGYATSTAWPDQLVSDLGRLLEDVDLDQLMLVRYNAVETAAMELSKAGIQKVVTRTALAKAMSRAIRESPSPKRLAGVLPWLKEEVHFIQHLNFTNMLEAIDTYNLSLESLSRSEVHQLARRIEKTSILHNLIKANDTAGIQRLMDSNLVPGFSLSLLEALPDEMLVDIINRTKPVWSTKKARVLVRMLRQRLSNTSQPPHLMNIKHLLNGLDLSDVRKLQPMNNSTFDDVIVFLKSAIVPDHIAWYLTKENVISSEDTVANQTIKYCDDFLVKLGKLAKFVDPRVIRRNMIIPLGEGDEKCPFDTDSLELSRTQAFAVVDNIREVLGDLDEDGTHVLRPGVITRLGKLSIGLAADDIKRLPINTDLLTVIEALSKYEDELDSSQISAIIGKIREYFDFPNRNVIQEMTEITVTQIARFLQYFNVDFELPKIPKRVRPALMREIGRSSLLKISTRQKQMLLSFALKNAAINGDIVDVTTGAFNGIALTDLGRLTCGLSLDLVAKMTSSAFNIHLQDLHDCPFKDDVAEAVVKKALAFNMNRLKQREHLAAMAGLLEYLSEEELQMIDQEELTPLTEYVIKSTNSREEAWRANDKSGFIRERTLANKQAHQSRKKRLLKKLYSANLRFYGSEDQCQTILKFGRDAVDLDLGSIDEDCVDQVATLPNWNPDEARTLLAKLAQTKLGRILSEDTARTLSEEFIRDTSGLLKGLSAAEIASLNLTEGAAFSVGSATGYTHEQLRNGFEALFPSKRELIGSEDLVNMQHLACGMSPREISSIKDKDAVRGAISSLAHVQGCSEEQLGEFAQKYSAALDDAVQNWDLADVHAMGHVLGGLSKRQLTRLSKRHLQAVEPFVITAMAPQKIANFTVEQLEEFTSNQKLAVTTMQRSYLSEPQVAALADNGLNIFTNGISSSAVPSIITIVLASLVGVAVYITGS